MGKEKGRGVRQKGRTGQEENKDRGRIGYRKLRKKNGSFEEILEASILLVFSK